MPPCAAPCPRACRSSLPQLACWAVLVRRADQPALPKRLAYVIRPPPAKSTRGGWALSAVRHDEPGALQHALAARALAVQIRWHWPRRYHQIVRPVPAHAPCCAACLLGPPVTPVTSQCALTRQGAREGARFSIPTGCAPDPPLPALCSEWAVNQHRDSNSLYVGMDSLAQFFAIAENESIGRVKFSCLQVDAPPPPPPTPSSATRPPDSRGSCVTPSMHPLLMAWEVSLMAVVFAAQKMIQPCGPPPPKEED